MRAVYGASEVEFHRDGLDDPQSLANTDPARWIAETRAAVAARKEWPRVITGHFWQGKYHSHFPDAFQLTWLRGPAARIISWYFCWKHGPDRGENELRAAVRAGLSLEEFIELPFTRNRVSGCF